MRYLQVPTKKQLPSNLQSDDFFHAKSGEMVTLSLFVCTNPRKREQCGCGRSLGDIKSMKASTILVVAEAPEELLAARFMNSELARDYAALADPQTLYEKLVLPLTQAIQGFPVGTLLRVYQSPTKFATSPIAVS